MNPELLEEARKSFNILFRYLDSELRQDIVQESLVKVYLGWHTYDSSVGKFNAWITCVGRNVYFDYLRVKHRNPVVVSMDDASIEDLDSSVDSFEYTEMIDLVLNGPFKNRDKLIFRTYLESGCSVSKTAKRINYPYTTVRKVIDRILSFLRRRIV